MRKKSRRKGVGNCRRRQKIRKLLITEMRSSKILMDKSMASILIQRTCMRSTTSEKKLKASESKILVVSSKREAQGL